VALEIVRMQLHEPRADEIAPAVDRPRRYGRAVVDGGDHPVLHDEAAAQCLFGQDKHGIGEQEGLCHENVISGCEAAFGTRGEVR